MKAVDNTINNTLKFRDISSFTREDAQKELDFIVSKINQNLHEFTYKFPEASSRENRYKPVDNICWTGAFWTAMLWMAYEYTGNKKYRNIAEIQYESFAERLDKRIYTDTHDLGFLYTLSCVAGYKLTGNEAMRDTALRAADLLMERYKEKGNFIQAWGRLDDVKSYRLIIDCMLNIPLLYWASETTGDRKYYKTAHNHAVTTMNTAVRSDASTHHTFFFDHETGAPLMGKTCQGYSDNSAWARGQAWAIYGFILSYIYTKDSDMLITSERTANYFLNCLPEDYICYWDLVFNDGSGEERDSSAAAIAVCGMLEIIKNTNDEFTGYYKNAVYAILHSLASVYSTRNTPEANSILLHGVYGKPQSQGMSCDESCLWGDYFYMEAMMRIYKNWNLYW